MAERCGVAPPPASAETVTGYLRAVAAWQAARGPVSGVQAVHLYPFGGLAATLRWMRDDFGLDDSPAAGANSMKPDLVNLFDPLPPSLP